MEILHVYAQNFCKFYGTNVLDIDFSHKTKISGQNEIGKSTVKRVILDVLNCRDEKDREITGIRPHDESGNEIDDVDIVRAVTFEIDGKKKTLQKVTRQRRSKEGKITGTVTDYSINDVPYKMADYNEFIGENIVDIVTLPYCINAITLLGKTPAEQRLTLSDFFKTHSDEEICDMFPEYTELKPMFEDGTLDQIKKVCRGKLNGTGGRNGSKGLIKERDDISTKLDYVHSNSTYTDLAELELVKKDYEVKLEQINEKLADNDKLLEAHKKETDGILQMKFDLSDMERKANEENSKARREIENKISDNQFLIKQAEKTIKDTENCIASSERTIESINNYLQAERDKWAKEKKREFDENSLICPYCGNEYKEDKREQLKVDFAKHKADNLKTITDNGNMYKERLDKEKATLESLKTELPQHRESLEMLNTAVADLEKQLSELPTDSGITESDEYKALAQRIAEKEKALNSENEVSELRKQLEAEKSEIIQGKADVAAKINVGTANNKRIDDNIADLENQRADLNQQICDWERKLDLLKDFTRKKNTLLQDDVNKYLDFCKASLFRPLINGDAEECCDFTYNGEAYARNLNHGARTLVEIDICRAFQKKANVNLPIIVDDTESVDDWRIPCVDNQLIMLKHTQDKELVIEAV